jgi:uncharacterized delta-60 repeat protein
MSRLYIRHFYLALALALPVSSARSAPGDMLAFATTEVDRSVNGIAVQPDGKILIAGNFATVGGITQSRLARLNADGTRQVAPDFVDRTINDNIFAIGLQADGKILITGRFTGVHDGANVFQARQKLARLNADGSLDATFTTPLSGDGYAIAVLPSGKMWIGGDFGLVSVSATGVLTPSTHAVRSGTSPGKVRAMAVQPDGKIVISGQFSHVGSTARRNIARLNADGTVDTTFKADTDNNVDTDGTGPKVSTSVFAVAVQPDGKVLVGGYFVRINGVSRSYLARLTSTGSVDTTFVAQVNSGVMAIALDSAAEIIIGGEFSNVNGFARYKLAKMDPLGRVYTNFSQFATAASSMQNGSSTAATAVYSLAQTLDGSILAGGIFDTATGGRKRIAKVENATAGTPSIAGLVDEASGTVALYYFSGAGTEPVVDAVTFLDTTGTVMGTSEGPSRNVFDGIRNSNGSLPVWKLKLTGQTTATVGSQISYRLRMHQLQNSSIYVTPDQTVTLGAMPVATLSSNSSSIPENADSTSNTLILTVNLPSAFSTEKKLKIEFAGSATSGADYTPLATEVVIPAQHTQQAVSVLRVKDDNILDADSNTVIVRIMDPVGDSDGLSILNGDHTLTITENDNPPVVTGDPVGGIFHTGTPFSMSGSFTSDTPARLQWFKDGKLLPGATQASLSFSSLTLAHAGAYQLRVTNEVANAVDFTNIANVTVVSPINRSYTKKAGITERVTFQSQAASPAILLYSWKRNGVTIPGADLNTLTLTNLDAGDSDEYECFIKTASDAAISGGIHSLNVVDGPPQLSDSFTLPTGRVTTYYDAAIPFTGGNPKLPTTIAITGLPPGLQFDTVTQRIVGRPTRPGTNIPITVVASNVVGTTRKSGTITIITLPATLLGQFVAGLDPVDATDIGGRADFVISSTGAVTGSFVVKGVKRKFTGKVNGGASLVHPITVNLLPLAAFGGDPSPSINITFGVNDTVQFFLNHTQLGRSGTGWRNVWSGGTNPREGRHNFGGTSTNLSAPAGGVAGSILVTNIGKVTVQGRLGDGASITNSSWLGPNGEVFIYQPLYSRKGFIRSPAGAEPRLSTGNVATVTGELDWFKDATTSGDYPAGFGTGLAPAALVLEGNRYSAPVPNALIMALTAGANNLRITVSEAELAAPSVLNATVSTTHKVSSISTTATVTSTLMTVSASTGKFTGSFNVLNSGIDPTRPASFTGWFWDSSGVGEGYGNFMLKKSLSSGNTSPRVSGLVKLSPP